jgi:asparaginyl-tRNA synthetase
MVEAELTTANLTTLIKLTESLIKHVLNQVLTENQAELEYFEQYQSQPIISRLTALTQQKFVRLDYTQAIKILKKKFKTIK